MRFHDMLLDMRPLVTAHFYVSVGREQRLVRATTQKRSLMDGLCRLWNSCAIAAAREQASAALTATEWNSSVARFRSMPDSLLLDARADAMSRWLASAQAASSSMAELTCVLGAAIQNKVPV